MHIRVCICSLRCWALYQERLSLQWDILIICIRLNIASSSDQSCIMALIFLLYKAAAQLLKYKYLPPFQRKKEIEIQLVDWQHILESLARVLWLTVQTIGPWLIGALAERRILLLLAIKQKRNLHFPADFIKVTMDSCGR